MEPAATIGQLRFDVRTTDVPLGRELGERVSQLFQHALQDVLTEELTRAAGLGPLRRLPELVLELPPIAASRLEQDLPGALRQALRRALADLAPAAGPGTGARALAGLAGLAGLRYFLLRGQLPWQLNSLAFALEAEVARALRQHPRALLALLREVGPQPWPRQRLARQLAPATMGQIINLLAPADAPVVRAYLADTLAAHRHRALAPVAEPVLRRVLHELVLADLLTHWHTQFNRRAFVERQLRQLAAHYGLSFGALLRQLQAALPVAGLPHSQAPTLLGIVHALYQPAPDAGPATGGLPAPAASASGLALRRALAYYLRHGSLPAAAGPPLPREALVAEVMRVLHQGRSELLALARAAGPPAATGLLALLPASQHAELVRLLAPGQTRPVLALLHELAGLPEAAAHRPRLWQLALALLLAAPAAAAVPALRRWLPLQVPALVAGATPGGTGPEQLWQYLLAGLAPAPGAGLPSPAQLRRELRRLLAQDRRLLLDFLRQYQARPLVLRHLAALAGFGLLAQLLPGGGRRPGPRRAATQVALAALLGEPTGQPGGSRQLLLREAYLHFQLRMPAAGDRALELPQLLVAHRVPHRALATYLRRQLRQWPVLAGSAFVKWLLAGLADGRLPAAAPLAAGAPTPWPAPASYWQRRWSGIDPGNNESVFAAKPTARSGAKPLTAGLADLENDKLPRNPVTGAIESSEENAPYLGSWPAAYGRLFGQPAAAGVTVAAGAGPPPARPGPGLHLAWPATAAEGLARLAACPPASARAPQGLGLLLRWLATREPARVATWLSAYLLAGPRGSGQPVLLDFALLRLLLGRARPAARQGLATLEALAGRELANSRALPALLRAAVLLGHFEPAGAGAALARLAAAYGLPARATATRLHGLAQRWPALVVLPGWQLLLAALPSPGLPTGLAVAGRNEYGPRAAGAGAGRIAPAAYERPAGGANPAGGVPADAAQASQDLLFHYLLHGRAPWWHTGALRPTALGQALRRAARPPQALREFLRLHGREAPVQRHLAALADFSLLHELLPPSGVGRGRRQLVRPALAALDRSLRRPASASQERLRLFLQEAYLAYAGATQPADPLAVARQRAAASGLAWRTVLTWAAALLHQHPALAADPFFGSLLHATLTRPAGPARPRPPRPAASSVPPGLPQPLAAKQTEAIPVGEETWALLEQYLQAGTGLAGSHPAQLLAGLPAAQAASVLARARPYLGSATARQRLAALLPPGAGPHLLRHWWPAAYRPLAEVARGWLRLAQAGLVQLPHGLAGVWEAVLAVAVAGGSPPLASLVARLLQADGPGRPTAERAQQVLQAAAARPRLPGPLAALLAVCAGEAGKPRRRERPAASPPASARDLGPATGPALAPGTSAGPGRPGSLALRPAAAEPGPADTAYPPNAGLVLLWPFLTMLFDRLGYLEERQFKTPALAERAAHLLHYLATGEEEVPEYVLIINKLLCGVEAARPLARAVLLTPEERSTGDGLLQAVIGRWEALKNTSVAGLRETFLQRAGRLDYHPERIALTVETKTLDILLDRLPWSISTIKLPWMPLPLYVTWR